ncbi:MAG: glycoside hydrolase family 2 protein [Dysgonamonadaceae bacterium]|jgi:beta-galactosidase|nr:glycoside hydrolase family 2 protein [Dysgonamonadaceae bacterium]
MINRKIGKYRLIWITGLFFGWTSLLGQINYPLKIRLNNDWEFLKGDLGSIWEGVRPIRPDDPEAVPLWEKVSLPHCFNAEDAVDPYTNYYEGPGWYRTYLDVRNPYENGRTILQFEGAGPKTTVYIYTTEVKKHTGGYDEWTCDITDAVKQFLQSKDAGRLKGKVPLLVRCDNSRDAEMIPSDLSDFTIYGGIYRYLNLVYLPEVSISQMQIDVQMDNKGKKGTVDLNFGFLNPAKNDSWKMDIQMVSPNGKILAEETYNPLSSGLPEFQLNIEKPSLWSPDTPVLYTCEARLITGKDTTVWRDSFGFRSYEFVEKGPFLLNGKRLLLKGTHRHEDHAGVGAAMTEEMMIREMEMIKAMGANFIRLGHYQQSRIILEQCDKLGILVWEEIPWCRGGLGGEAYQHQAKEMLSHMITQHRNHPSVILWGLGNENDWPNDFPTFDQEAIRSFMRELNDLSHQLDGSRLTAIRRCDFCKDIPDVYSPSIWAGWYSNKYIDYQELTKKKFNPVPRFLHVEWGGDSHARRHAEHPNAHSKRPPTDGDWSETYICDLFDWHLKEQENMPWLTGTAFWVFKDFATPIRPENPVPYVNQKGVVERDLTLKESYYVFQSYWTDAPMIHIYGHTWPVRWGDAEEEKELKVYSNCEEVTLFLNGQRLDKKKRHSQDFPAAGLRWKTALKKGKNTVQAIGKKGKQTVSDEITFEYQTEKWGKEVQIKLSVMEDTPAYAWIEAELLDEKGVLCLDSGKFLFFESVGDGHLMVNQGTSFGSKKVQASNGKARVKLDKNGGRNVVSVRADGIRSVFIDLF